MDTTIAAATQNALNILAHYLPTFTAAYRGAVSQNGFYTPTPNNDWTEGFQTGQYWLAWQLCGEEDYRLAALRQVESFRHRLANRVVVDHHDMGFLFSPSCAYGYTLTGDATAKETALAAADTLLGRFQEKGQFFQAWGSMGAPEEYRLIIDCLMNLPLLFWASAQTGRQAYGQKAAAHIQTALATLIRQDDSTYHTFYFDPATGAPLRGATAQGYAAHSAWARGQAWGVYGFALAYKYTGDEACKQAFHRVARFYLAHLPADFVPYWDLFFTQADGEPLDSSAAAIAACGMLEMAPFLGEEDARMYTQAAEKTAHSLAQTCAVASPTQSNGLLLHGVYAKSSPYNTVADNGVDECTAWGDYFYLELLARLQGKYTPLW